MYQFMLIMQLSVCKPKEFKRQHCVCTCPVCRQGSLDTPSCLGSVCPQHPSETAKFSTSDIYLKTESIVRSAWFNKNILFGLCMNAKLTTLNSDGNLHGTSSLVSQLWRRRCRPARRQVSKLIPKLHNAFLSCRTQMGTWNFMHSFIQYFVFFLTAAHESTWERLSSLICLQGWSLRTDINSSAFGSLDIW